MKNVLNTGFYAIAGLMLIWLNSANAAISAGWVTNQSIVTQWSADIVIQGWLANLLGFLYLAAVLIAIWGGFNILTAAWDEEKVKKGKTILIQAGLWIVVIFLAGSIIEWIIGSIVK
jgi:hypothetical protein